MTTKTVNLTYHEGNNNRRVKYNDRNSFDVLVVNFDDGTRTRSFQIKSEYLTDKDSIHLKYDPITHIVSWAPLSVDEHVKEL